ncbi:MAM domain-containing glycosylphosphatidylinositol anchor protein 1-like [Ruditapes philippinarum]|uniref:MAM domain-containing glycosylphosphatidylinositol anchor protein 1-like n=1 Tax=Ruditapes philippinarum TaxID=129788 RepID=UPI00295B64E1|nr:MAM domain-containing glycosylphosphatidylinositol anchor protein 1-like [Ruditapes philippinarum]
MKFGYELFAYLYAVVSVLAPCSVKSADHSSLAEVDNLVKCSFDNDICNWRQSTGDDFDWTLLSGNTPTTNTGPPTDHTYRNSSGKYIFIETSAPRQLNEKATLISPLIDTWNNNYMCFSMWFYAYGSNIGNLQIVRKQSQYENKTETLWTNNFQGPSWQHTSVTILPTGPFQIIIEGTVGDGYLGDIAVDDVEITEGNCTAKLVRIICIAMVLMCNYIVL